MYWYKIRPDGTIVRLHSDKELRDNYPNIRKALFKYSHRLKGIFFRSIYDDLAPPAEDNL